MMTEQRDSKGELRTAYAMRELENAKRSVRLGNADSTGPTSIFLKVTLAIIFMYLIGISYLMLGITGPVFVSLLFLAALLAPFFYHLVKDLQEKPGQEKTSPVLDRESRQES